MVYSIEVVTSEGTTDLTGIFGLKLVMTQLVTIEASGSVELPSGVDVSKCSCIPSSGFISVWITPGNSRLNWSFPFGTGGATNVSVMVVEAQ